MGELLRDRLPDPIVFFQDVETLKLDGKGKWRTTECRFHDGSDSMRINISNGAWVCMACGVKGGDVISYHMQAHGMDFIEACKALNAWNDDGLPSKPQKPRALSALSALEVIAFEATLVAVAAGNVAHGVKLTDVDRFRLLTAAARINRIREDFA